MDITLPISKSTGNKIRKNISYITMQVSDIVIVLCVFAMASIAVIGFGILISLVVHILLHITTSSTIIEFAIDPISLPIIIILFIISIVWVIYTSGVIKFVYKEDAKKDEVILLKKDD